MTSSKSRIRSAVTSSLIRRAVHDEFIEVNDPNNLPRHAPFEEPKNIESIYNQKAKKCFDVKFLSKTEVKLLNKINSLILEKIRLTDPVYLEQLTVELSHPITTLKKTIQKLEKKGFIKRESFKSGRGGWTIYSVDEEVRVKLELN